MNNIYHTLWIKSSKKEVFEMLSISSKLDLWWTLKSSGTPKLNEIYELYFGPKYNWKAKIVRYEKNEKISFLMTQADADWLNSKLHFSLSIDQGFTKIDFIHEGWPEINEHFTQSSYCWAMYLRCIKRFLEQGEVSKYEMRTNN